MDALITKYPPVQNAATSAKTLKVNAGPTYVALPAGPVVNIVVSNVTGQTIVYQQDGAGEAFPIPTGTLHTIRGVDDTSRIAFKRLDGGTAVDIYVRAER